MARNHRPWIGFLLIASLLAGASAWAGDTASVGVAQISADDFRGTQDRLTREPGHAALRTALETGNAVEAVGDVAVEAADIAHVRALISGEAAFAAHGSGMKRIETVDSGGVEIRRETFEAVQQQVQKEVSPARRTAEWQKKDRPLAN